ncbi:unnamed protein product, partial [Polarella glacialis]
VVHLAPGALASGSHIAMRMLLALEQVPDSLLSLLRHLPPQEQNSILAEALKRLLESARLLRSRGQPSAADSVSTFAARMVLTYLSACLVREITKRYPHDAPVERVMDDGTKSYGAMPFEVPGAASVRVSCTNKKAMNADILLSTKSRSHAMDMQLEDPHRVVISTRVSSDTGKVVFKPGFGKISEGLVNVGFDRASSKGEGKEEFTLLIKPVFKTIRRESIDALLGSGHFKEIVEQLLPAAPNDPHGIRGAPLAVIQACSFCYSVLAQELAKNDSQLQCLTPEYVSIYSFIRLVRDVIYRLEAARPGEEQHRLLEDQVRVVGETLLIFSESSTFRDAMLGGADWEYLPLFLDILRRRRREEWVRTISYVLAQLLGVSDRMTGKEKERAAMGLGKKKQEERTKTEILAEHVPSPFSALLMYVDAATATGVLRPVHAKVLTHVVDIYSLLLEEGWQPTFAELEKRPHNVLQEDPKEKADAAVAEAEAADEAVEDADGEERSAGQKKVVAAIDGQDSDLFKFVTLLVSSQDPKLRGSCFKVLAGLSARPYREQRLFHVLKTSKTCMEQPDPKTMKAYQGLPPQSLTFALPNGTIQHPPFAYSFWIQLQSRTSRSELRRKNYFIMGHYTLSSRVPVISVTLAPGHGPKGTEARLELWVGNDVKAPFGDEDDVEAGAADKKAGERAIIKAGKWVHVALVIQHRAVLLYLQGELLIEEPLRGRLQFTQLTPEPQRGVCFVGFPPPELLNYVTSISVMEGLIANMTYHDEGLTEREVYDAFFRSRHMLPKEPDILLLEEENDRNKSIMYPYYRTQPSALMWLVISDRWHQVDKLLFAVLNSKTYLNRHGRDKATLDIARDLRSAAIKLLLGIIDLDSVVPHRVRSFALNFAHMKQVIQSQQKQQEQQEQTNKQINKQTFVPIVLFLFERGHKALQQQTVRDPKYNNSNKQTATRTTTICTLQQRGL